MYYKIKNKTTTNSMKRMNSERKKKKINKSRHNVNQLKIRCCHFDMPFNLTQSSPRKIVFRQCVRLDCGHAWNVFYDLNDLCPVSVCDVTFYINTINRKIHTGGMKLFTNFFFLLKNRERKINRNKDSNKSNIFIGKNNATNYKLKIDKYRSRIGKYRSLAL